MKKLFLLLLLLPIFAFAATIGSGGWTCFEADGIEPGDGTTGDPTIDSGSNRRLLYVLQHNFAASYSISVFTVGGQSASENFNDLAVNIDSTRTTVYIWDETAIGAMSGSTVSFTDNASSTKDTAICWVTLVDTDQTALGDFLDSQECTVCTTEDVTTTSLSGDYVVVPVAADSNSGTFDDCDTLTEIADSQTDNSTFGLCAGDGGDNTTTVTYSTSTEIKTDSMVFVNVAITALLRRHGR